MKDELKNLDELQSAMFDFQMSTYRLYEAWSKADNSLLTEAYPFEKSFDEVMLDIWKWCETNLM